MDSNVLTTRLSQKMKRQRGVSLIELMIGMVIGLVLLGGILQTMLASKEAAATRQSISTITDNARFLFDFMARDLRMGGRGYGRDGWPKSDPADPASSDLNPIEVDDNGTLIVRYLDADNVAVQVEYSHDEDKDQIEYRRGEGGVFGDLEPLIGGVDSLEFAFAVFGDPSEYEPYDPAATPTWENVTAVQTTVVFIDEAPWGGQDQAIDAKQISSTVALRNQVSRLINP
jgi:type IV pilus assembly protein PilW